MSTLSREFLEQCASDPLGPVALHFRQELVPVEGKGAPFFPATFAMDAKYNIDKLADGTEVALVDSVGSQANRMEPIFLRDDLRGLVPQVTIRYGDATHETVSLLEAGHRLGDAVVRCTELAAEAREAFVRAGRNDAEAIARLAPTSLVFGAWDSRDTGVKVPRIVQSVIRAWDVSRLTRSAQFNPALDYAAINALAHEDDLKADDKKAAAERGYLHVPSTGDHGGIVSHGPILRDVTVNLVALRRLDAADALAMRRYLLGLALLAASEPLDPFLRQGCLLVPDADAASVWTSVGRDGSRTSLSWDTATVEGFARASADAWGIAAAREVRFDTKLASADHKKGKKK